MLRSAAVQVRAPNGSDGGRVASCRGSTWVNAQNTSSALGLRGSAPLVRPPTRTMRATPCNWTFHRSHSCMAGGDAGRRTSGEK